MSFTIATAKVLAESWIDDVIDEYLILIWGNEFLQRIVNDKVWETRKYASSFRGPDPMTLVEVDGYFVILLSDTWYELPDDFFRSIKVEDADGILYASYTIKNGLIKFANEGPYTLTYIAYPSKLTSISGAGNEIPLPDAFEYPLSEFLAFRYYALKANDDFSKKASSEYEQRYKSSLKRLYGSMELNSETESFQIKMRW